MAGSQRWLFWKGRDQQSAAIHVKSNEQHTRITQLNKDPLKNQVVLSLFDRRGDAEPVRIGNAFASIDGNEGVATGIIPGEGIVSEVLFIEPRTPSLNSPLHDAYSQAVRRGHRSRLNALVGEVASADEVLILTESGRPVVSLLYPNHAVPAALSGDGIWSLLEINIRLVMASGSLALLEEPEVSQHPRALWHTARAIVAAARSGIQVVVSTHSLEFIDVILAAIPNDEELDILSVYGVVLEDGQLKNSRIAGDRVAFLRGTIGEDLR